MLSTFGKHDCGYTSLRKGSCCDRSICARLTWATSTYTKQAVVLGAIQKLVQLIEGAAGRVPRQELLLLGQVADKLQRHVLGQEPGSGKGHKKRRMHIIEKLHTLLKTLFDDCFKKCDAALEEFLNLMLRVPVTLDTSICQIILIFHYFGLLTKDRMI